MSMENQPARCGLCGEPMPPGEEMFSYHGYSGPCPKAPLSKEDKGPVEEPDWLCTIRAEARVHPSHVMDVETLQASLRQLLGAYDEAIERTGRLLASHQNLVAAVAVIHGRGPEAVIPEVVSTPLQVPVRLREIMAEAEAAIAEAS